MCQLPDVGHLIGEGIRFHLRILFVVEKERSEGGVAGEHQPEGVELGRPFNRQDLGLENGARLGAEGADRHTQGVCQRLEHGRSVQLAGHLVPPGKPSSQSAAQQPRVLAATALVVFGVLRLAQ